MAVLTIRNVPDEVHRALRLRAAQQGRSTEAEVREILESAVRPGQRVRLGSAMADISRRAGVTSADVQALEQALDSSRGSTPHEPMRFE